MASSSSRDALDGLSLPQAMDAMDDDEWLRQYPDYPPVPAGWDKKQQQEKQHKKHPKKQPKKQKRQKHVVELDGSDDEDYVPDEEEEEEEVEDQGRAGSRRVAQSKLSLARQWSASVQCNAHCIMVASTGPVESSASATLAASESSESFMQTLTAADLVGMCEAWKAFDKEDKNYRQLFRGRLFMNFEDATVDYSVVLQTIMVAQPLPGGASVSSLASRYQAICSFAAELKHVSLELFKLFTLACEHVNSRGTTLHSKWCPLHASNPQEIFGQTPENHKAVMVSLGGITFKEYLDICKNLKKEPYKLWGDVEDCDMSRAIEATLRNASRDSSANEFLTAECLRKQNIFQYQLHDVLDRYSHIYFNMLSFKDSVGTGLVLNEHGFCEFLSDIFYFPTSAMTVQKLLESSLNWFQAMLQRLLVCVGTDNTGEVDSLKQNLDYSRSQVCAKKKVHAQETCLAYFVEKLKSVVAEELKRNGTDDTHWKQVLTQSKGQWKILATNRDRFGALFGYLKNWPNDVMEKAKSGNTHRDSNTSESELVDVYSRAVFADAFFGCADGNNPCRDDVKRIFMLMSGKSQRFEAYFIPALVAEGLRCGYTRMIAHCPGFDALEASPARASSLAPSAALGDGAECSSLALLGNTDCLSVRRDPNVSMAEWLENICDLFGIDNDCRLFRDPLQGAVSLLGDAPERQSFFCKWWNGADQCTVDNLVQRLSKQTETCDAVLAWVETAKTLTDKALDIYSNISQVIDRQTCTTSSSLVHLSTCKEAVQRLSEDLQREVSDRPPYSPSFLNKWLMCGHQFTEFRWTFSSDEQRSGNLVLRIELIKSAKELLVFMTEFISTRSKDELTFGFRMVFDLVDAICKRDPVSEGSSLFWRFSDLSKIAELQKNLEHLNTFFECYTKAPSRLKRSLTVRICDAYKWLVWWSCDESNNLLKLVPKGFIVRERMAVSAVLSLLSIAYSHGVLLVTSDRSVYECAYDDDKDYFMAVLTGDANQRRISMRQQFDSVLSSHWLTFCLFAAISRVVMDATIDNAIDTSSFVPEESLLVYLFDDNNFCYARNECGEFDEWIASMVSSISYFYPGSHDFTVFSLTTRQQLATLFNACPHMALKNGLFEMQSGHYFKQAKDAKLDRDISDYNFYHSFYRFDDSVSKDDFHAMLPMYEADDQDLPESCAVSLAEACYGDHTDHHTDHHTDQYTDQYTDQHMLEETESSFDKNIDAITAYLLS